MNEQAITKTGKSSTSLTIRGMPSEDVALMKRTIARGATDDELELFLAVSQRLGLDPFLKQIHAVKRWDPALKHEVMAIQIGIDGYRLGATRTGEEDGQDGPFWCGADGVWHDVWLSKDEAPVGAKVLVYRKGRSRPYIGIALWASYVQYTKDGEVTSMWRKHGPGQLAKCAEALALRKAFPAELGGTHTPDEFGDVIDAEYTELKPIAGTPAAVATATSVAAATTTAASATPAPRAAAAPATTTPASAASAAPPAQRAAKDTRPFLTEDEVDDIIEAIGKTESIPDLRQIATKRINTARMTDEQRTRLLKAYEEQLAELKRADAPASEGAAP